MFTEVERQQLKFDQVVLLTLVKDTFVYQFMAGRRKRSLSNFEAKEIPSTRKYRAHKKAKGRRLAQASSVSLNLG